MQPPLLSIALFPPPDYMALVAFHPEVTLEVHENYQKQSYRSRYYIMGPNGKQMLQVPVDKKGLHPCPVREAGIAPHSNWPVLHVRALEAAYNKSPWYLYYKHEIESFYSVKEHSLLGLCVRSVELSLAMLGKTPSLRFTSSYRAKDPGMADFTKAIHPKRGNQPWVAAQQEMAYHQVFDEKYGFLPNLSVLDLIFNEGPAALEWLERYYRVLLQQMNL